MSQHCLFCYEPLARSKSFYNPKISVKPCNHTFHWSCYQSWTKFYEDCSYCGAEIKNCTTSFPYSVKLDFAIREDQLLINGWGDEETAWSLLASRCKLANKDNSHCVTQILAHHTRAPAHAIKHKPCLFKIRNTDTYHNETRCLLIAFSVMNHLHRQNTRQILNWPWDHATTLFIGTVIGLGLNFTKIVHTVLEK